MSTPPPPPMPSMPPLPPPFMRDQRATDQQHLQLLMIFHFVAAGLALLGTLFLFAHYMIFSTVFMNPQMWQQAQQQQHAPPFNPQELFGAFRWFYLILGLWFLLGAVSNIISGLFLRKRKNRTFSLIVAGLNCVHIPLGTVLGVFTIIVLVRPSVAELYESNPPS